jgi:A/G-specific adenine glycosylase
MARAYDPRDRAFKTAVRSFGRKNLRSFPWRDTTDPYRILVSEIMLQQTQTDRVVPKYECFLKRFPTARSLANAPLGDVLREWSGLGYNRRAKLLHACAQAVTERRGGKFPDTYEGLLALPGIGPYTAGAVLAFAFNVPHPIIETNIRTVYLHHFHPEDEGVADRELMAHIERTLDRTNARRWYAMLMDYGSFIKKHHGNHNVRSRSYVRQSKFKGSAREARGAIIRALKEGPQTLASIIKTTKLGKDSLARQAASLIEEGMVCKEGRKLRLP